jgi:hypothetical protein
MRFLNSLISSTELEALPEGTLKRGHSPETVAGNYFGAMARQLLLSGPGNRPGMGPGMNNLPAGYLLALPTKARVLLCLDSL